MARKKPGVMLYFEIRPSLKRLSDEEKGRLFEAILDYGENGTVPDFDGGLGIAWDFIQPRIDADSQRYQKVSQARSAAAAARWEQKNKQTDANAFFAMQTMPTTTSTTTTTSSSTERVAPGETAAPADGQKPDRKTYGLYGWIKLSDEEYNRLSNELGEAELKRCIDYIDESAQANGNKNHWRDWFLVIKRCSKNGWGLQKGKTVTKADSAASAREDLMRMDKYWEHIQSEEEEPRT